MKTFKIAALCLSMAAAAFTVQAKEIKYEADVAIVGGGPAGMVAAAYAAENGLTCKSSKDHSKPRNEVDTSLKSPV